MDALSSAMIPSPVGDLELVASGRGLVAVLWRDDRPGRVRLGPRAAAPEQAILRRAADQLGAYFAGVGRGFSVPLDLRGTPFQRRVWAQLAAIPYGETRTYGQLACALDGPRSVRAVGAANGRNPVAIVLPCHRVVGARGALVGFAGGLANKAALLALEARHA